ncbi:MAG TPA: AAA family ATPase [Blastocatellia bacterium]|nr:AAA family ATPase [Blastocatellia bacterium]
MFRLEKLEIIGFKSFADRTTLVFGEGITGVVGPNGCGKSNIAEAISWVLGEQSAKNMRGGKMEDVIFNGTRDRKPTGLAEVLLTMVATEDIAARDSDEAGNSDEQEFDHALTNAQRAADSARCLVDELAPQEKLHAEPPDCRASNAPDNTTEPIAHADEAAFAASGQEAEAQTPPDESSAEIRSDLSVSQLEVQPSATDAGAESDAKQPKKRNSPRPPKRRRIAISAGERVIVGRRLYRTGDSDYLMNGRPCLLRDVQDLFAGTGLGGAHYAIIEQGRIGQILSSKPLDRRGLIEEAAGITKFKSRKRAAELKLESAKQNLTRLNDIISEIERQMNSLKRQAQKARRHRRLREEMRSLMKVVFTSDHYRLSAAIERVGRDLEEAGRTQQGLDLQLAERETEHRGVSAHARSAEDLLAGLREQASALELEADRARNRRAFEEQQIKELGARIEELNRDQHSFDTRLSTIDEEARRRGESLRALEAELAGAQAGLLARESEYQAQLSHLREADAAIEMLRQRMVAQIGATERLRNLGASLQDSLKRLDLKQSSLQAEFERAAARRDEAESEHSRVQSEAEHGRVRLQELTGRIAERAAEVITLRDERNALRTEIERTQAERNAARHRLASLEDLDAHRAYYSDAVQQVLSTEQAARINALGTLADFVEVDSQYEALVESLFGRELQSVLVPTIDDALAGVDYIKSEELGRGAFLVVGLHGGEEDGSDSEGREDDDLPEHDKESRVDWGQGSVFEVDERGRVFDSRSDQQTLQFHLEVLRAIDLLGLRPEIKTVVEHAFPEKCAAAVVPDLEAALQLSIENQSRIYVTSDGEMVINGRLIVTGAQAGQRGTSLLALKREIKELRTQTETLSIEQERFTGDIDRVELRLGGMEGEAATLDAELREHEKSAAARNSQIEGLARDLERARQHARVVEIELEQARDERREHEARSEEVALDLSAAEALRLSVQASLDEAQSSLARMRVAAEQVSEQLSGARASAAALGERLHAARAEMRRIESETEELNSRINRNRLELYESHGRIDELTTSQADAEISLALFEADRALLDEGINTATGELQSARARADELESLLSEMRQAASAAHDRRSQFEVERARIESETEHLARMCLSELAMSLEDVVTSVEISGQWPQAGDQGSEVRDRLENAEDAQELGSSDEKPAGSLATDLTDDSDAGKERLDELRRKLDEIGPVNMMALEELEESEQRFKFLSEQRRDILDSIRMTEEALAEIRRRSRERFRHAFTHINENFRQMFVELFGGGRGEMILIDEDDVLESGIDLIAQPPGKRLQNVLLLSGGEKAMAAIALVLAIFQYRPSPFCILDEVDAPLDEVNVGRFSEKVIEMSRGTQFLVITHNKRTMEAARALYGVTMEQPGVSKLVSVKFE